MLNYKTSKVTKCRITKGRKLQNVEKGRKLRYSMGKIRGRISSLRIKKVAKNSPRLFLLVNSVEKKTNVENSKSLKQVKHKII
jgi:hypothetical protein